LPVIIDMRMTISTWDINVNSLETGHAGATKKKWRKNLNLKQVFISEKLFLWFYSTEYLNYGICQRILYYIVYAKPKNKETVREKPAIEKYFIIIIYLLLLTAFMVSFWSILNCNLIIDMQNRNAPIVYRKRNVDIK